MKALLVHAGIDSAFGHWNAPVNPETGEFVYVPIPESVTARRSGTRDAQTAVATGRRARHAIAADPSGLLQEGRRAVIRNRSPTGSS